MLKGIYANDVTLAGPGGALGRSDKDAGWWIEWVSFPKDVSESCPCHADGSHLVRLFCPLVCECSLKRLIEHILSYKHRG